MAIDWDALRATLLERKLISPKKHAEFLEDEDALPNAVLTGKTVLSLGWDGAFPGASGAIWVTCWKGLYFCRSSDLGPEGPFNSLDLALELDWFTMATSNPDLASDHLPLAELLSIGRGLLAEEGEAITINGKPYCLRGGELVKSQTP